MVEHLAERSMSIWARGRLAALLSALALAVVVGAFSARDSHAAGPFPINGVASSTKIYFDGPCNAGNIAAGSDLPATGGIGAGRVIQTTGNVFGCLATECSPENLIIGSELFTYASVSAKTVTPIPSNTWTGDLVVANLPEVTDLPGGGSCQAQNHFPNEFDAPAGHIYVNGEQLHYSARDGDSFTIDSRGVGGTIATDHAPGSMVRAQNKLKLLKRGVPRFQATCDLANPVCVAANNASLTAEAAHSAGSAVSSPKVFMNCRGLALENVGGVQAMSRSRCYFALEPGYVPVSCSATPFDADCFWPDGPVPAEYLQTLNPVGYHELSEGTLTPTGATAALALKTKVGGVDCFPQIDGFLWVQIETTTTLDKTFTAGDQDDGALQIRAYTNGSCSGPAILTFGGQKGLDNNLRSIQLPDTPPPDDTDDTDGDNCPDRKELGPSQAAGGARDPFNGHDYMNPTGDGLNRVDDIVAVVNQYFDDDNDSTPGLPPYVSGYQAKTDRTLVRNVTTGAPTTVTWSLSRGNGQQRVDDIVTQVRQYFYDCS